MQIPTSLNTLSPGLTVERLLAELEENFQTFLPQPSDPQNLIMYRSGQRSVVEWVRSRIDNDDT
jgi:hypothetical protein